MLEQQVLLHMCAKLLLGGGPQGIANLQLLQGFLRNTLTCTLCTILLQKGVFKMGTAKFNAGSTICDSLTNHAKNGGIL